MPVDVSMVVGPNLTYDADMAATTEEGGLDLFRDNRLIGQVKPDAWTSWEAYEEVDDDDDDDEPKAIMGPDLDERGADGISEE